MAENQNILHRLYAKREAEESNRPGTNEMRMQP